MVKINNGLILQWLLKSWSNDNIPTGSSDKSIDLPISYKTKHYNAVVGHGTRMNVICTVLDHQKTILKVGFRNMETFNIGDIRVFVISIGI